MDSHPGIRITPQLVFGLLIATIGVMFTLDNLHILRARQFVQFWPLAFVLVGLAQIAQARTSAGVVGGGIWIFVGAVMLGGRLGLWDANLWDFWPLILVLVGGRIVWQAYSGDPGGGTGVDRGGIISGLAVMGGCNRKIVSSDFRGAELTAFMGGGKLDLREAAMADGQAVVRVLALMGGFEILVPDTWNVVVEATPFLGGVDVKARTSLNPSAPRLIVRGFVMMGGLDIKN
jgi:predicted membrane protein